MPNITILLQMVDVILHTVCARVLSYPAGGDVMPSPLWKCYMSTAHQNRAPHICKWANIQTKLL